MTQGWSFSDALPDHLHGFQYLHQVYSAADPQYTGRVLVPVLWDKKTRTIVSNESSEILRMFNEAFAAFARNDVDLYPVALRPQIDEANAFVYDNINNGVYRCGFATEQAAYERAFDRLFSALDRVEGDLGQRAWLAAASSRPRRTGGSSPRSCASMPCTSVTSNATATASKTSRTSRAICTRCIGCLASRQR